MNPFARLRSQTVAMGLAAWLLGTAVVASAQDGPAGGLADSFLFSDGMTGRSGDALGNVFRGGFVTGPGVGREDGFGYLNTMPYFFLDDGMFFGDLRGFRSTSDGWGANLGGGYRHYVRSWDRIIGVNAYFDYDNSSGSLFRQMGFGAETLGRNWDSRLNVYIPVTDDTALLSTRFLQSSVRFSGNNILFDRIQTFGTHMRGIDHEVAVPLPGRIMEQIDARIAAGWYSFENSKVTRSVGWKGRLQAELTPNIATALEVTNDSVFDTNVVFTVALQYGGFRERNDRPKSQFSRMTTPVRRQFTAVVARNDVLESGLVATKADGTPYFIEHVAGQNPYDRGNVPALQAIAPQYNPAATLGTFENPFLTIADAQANPGGDIIYTWTNSAFDATNVALEPGVRVLGEGDGVVHQIAIAPFGLVNMPRAVDNVNPAVPELRPIFTNTTGDGVVLASNAEFSGFRLGDSATPGSGPTGNGIVGDTINNTVVRFTDVNFAGGDGVLLTNVNTVLFQNDVIFNAANIGFHVVGGIPSITFEGDGDPTTPEIVSNVPGNGNAVQIDGTLGGTVDLFGANPSAISYTGGGGIFINAAQGSALFGDVSIANTTPVNPNAINIIDSSGVYTFGRPIAIATPGGDGINIDNLTANGRGIFNSTVNITERTNRGINLNRIDGNIRFSDNVTITSTVAPLSAFPGIIWTRSAGNITFEDISLDGGAGFGLVIGELVSDNTGTFTVTGATAIQNFAGTSLAILDDDSTVQFNGVGIDNRGQGILISNQRGDVTFNGLNAISNTGLSTQTAMVLSQNTGNILFDQMNILGATAPAFTNGIAGLDANNNPGSITFNQLNITSTSGRALVGVNIGDPTLAIPTGGLFVNAGTINSTFESAIDVQGSVISMLFTSVTSIQAAGEGVRLVNNAAPTIGALAFSIDPGVDIVGAGGRIVQSSNEGVLAQDTGSVFIRGVDFVQNGIFNDRDGIFASSTTGNPDFLSVRASNLTQSGLSGIHTTSIPNVTIVNARFLQNGVSAVVPQILLESGLIPLDGPDTDILPDPYIFFVDTINLTENQTNGFEVTSLAGGAGSILNFTLQNSNLTLNAGAGTQSALNVNWTGPMGLLIDTNQIAFLGSSNGGIDITAGSTTDPAGIIVTNNVFTGPSFSNTGLLITAQNPTTIAVNNNTFNQGGIFDTATFFTLGANADVTMNTNIVTSAGDQSRGFVFQTIAGPSIVRMNDNDLLFSDNDGFLDERGVEFISTVGTISFNGTLNNIITIDNANGIGFPWFIFPLNGAANGSVIINNSPQP